MSQEADLRDERGFTRLHWAVQRGDIVEVRRLLAAGASVHVATLSLKDDVCHCGSAAVHIASRFGFVEIACLLLEYGANVDAEDSTRFVILLLLLSWLFS
jgi:ankyrin repeat protein